VFAPTDPFAFAEACVAKGAVSGLAGGVMGGVMGVLFGSVSPYILFSFDDYHHLQYVFASLLFAELSI